jgi:hypothetical protein
MKTDSAKSLKFKPEKPLKPQVKLFKNFRSNQAEVFLF